MIENKKKSIKMIETKKHFYYQVEEGGIGYYFQVKLELGNCKVLNLCCRQKLNLPLKYGTISLQITFGDKGSKLFSFKFKIRL